MAGVGFADVEDDEVVFTDADVDALKLIDGLIESGVVDPSLEAAVARAAGQSLSRLAEWEIGLLYDHVTSHAHGGTEQTDPDSVLELVETILPVMEQLHATCGDGMSPPSQAVRSLDLPTNCRRPHWWSASSTSSGTPG